MWLKLCNNIKGVKNVKKDIKKIKGLKPFIWFIFVMYLIVLIYVILLKCGFALIMARSLQRVSFIENISRVQIFPFKTIIGFFYEGVSSTIIIQNILGNILAFSPLGFLLPLLSNKYNKVKKIFVVGLITSLTIELIQLFFYLGSSDIDDIILNVLGTIIGFYVFKLANKWLITNKNIKCLSK